MKKYTIKNKDNISNNKKPYQNILPPLLIIVIILIITSTTTSAMFDNEYAIMDVSITGKINIEKEQGHVIDYIAANLTFFPKEYEFQKILSSSYEPSALKNNNYVYYKWDENVKSQESFSLNSQIKVYNDYPKVKRKIDFPIRNILPEYEIYIKPTENIDSDKKEIINIASEIVTGEDDLFQATSKVATWIRDNINYSLDSLTANSVQKSSWVLENRYGVCDEITALFIGMTRSVGIPSRYVSGLAYTNYNDIYDWEPHAWAEVYFPNYGWVPFDITYNELGRLDPSHIVLLKSLDSGETSTKYQWKAKNVAIQAEAMQFKTELIEKGKTKKNNIELNVKLVKDKIGFGSYNLLEVELTNHNNFYVTEYMQISLPKEVSVVNKKIKDIILKPKQVKMVYYILKLDADLEKQYAYDFPILVLGSKNQTVSFSSSFKDNYYNKDFFSFVKQEEELSYSQDISLICESDKIKYYVYEKPSISCIIKNIGNTPIKNLMITSDDISKTLELGILQEEEIDFEIILARANQKDYQIKATNGKIKEISNIRFSVLDTPRLNISDISYPKKVEYSDNFKIEFLIKQNSLSNALRTEVRIINNNKNNGIQTFNIGTINKNNKFILEMKGKELNSNNNNLDIVVDYYDDNKNRYTKTSNISIELHNLNMFEKVIISLKNII